VSTPALCSTRKSLNEGAILVPGYPVGSPGWQCYANYELLDPAKTLSAFTDEQMQTLLHGGEGTVELTFKNGKPWGRIRGGRAPGVQRR
jgi:hypothetical protein